MKQFFFFAALLSFSIFSSCSNNAGNETGTTAASNNQQAMLEANRQIYKGIETGDSALLQKYIADDAVDHNGGPNGEDLRGHEIIAMLMTAHRDIDNLQMNVEQTAANDNYVFSLVHMTGTTNKPVWCMPANTKIDSRSVDVLRMQNGKAVEHWGYMSPAEMMQMMQGNQMKGDSGRVSMNKQ